MRSCVWLAIAVVAAFVLCAPAMAQRLAPVDAVLSSETVEVRATVVTADGAPVSGALVFTNLGGRGVTGLDGSTVFQIAPPPDSSALQVTAVGLVGAANHVGSVSARVGDGVVEVGRISVRADTECRPSWLPMFVGTPPGTDSRITCAVVFDDGNGPAVYVAGPNLRRAGKVHVHGIARWDGNEWSSVGGLGAQLPPTIFDLLVADLGDGPALYAAGAFKEIGGVPANNVAKWDGSAWTDIGAGIERENFNSFQVNALEVISSDSGPVLIAGGQFVVRNGTPRSWGIAAYDGERWQPMAPIGVPGANVVDLAVFGEGEDASLYAIGSGFLTTIGSFARLTTSGWVQAGEMKSSDSPLCLEVFDDGSGAALFVGGSGNGFDSILRFGLAKWDGATLAQITGLEGHNSLVIASDLEVFDPGDGPVLVVSGYFIRAGDDEAVGIAQFDGEVWNGLGASINGSTSGLTVFDAGDRRLLIVGAQMSRIGDISVQNVAAWDGQQWHPLGDGASEPVTAFAVFDDGAGPVLYAAGTFPTPDGPSAFGVARWDGAAWRALGEGLSVGVNALAVFDDGGGDALYAAGGFIYSGETAVNRIAKWDGAEWSPLADGLDGPVHAIAVFDDGAGPALYVGGEFETAGGVASPGIARWDGAQWSSVGGGVAGVDSVEVLALESFDDGAGPSLFVGGNFDSAGGIGANNVARWDGAAWSPLGIGLDGWVNDFAVFEEAGVASLFAGGSIRPNGFLAAQGIARWDGAAWTTVGEPFEGVITGVNGWVDALAVFDDGSIPALYVSGFFQYAGQVQASAIVRWTGEHWTRFSHQPLGADELFLHDFGFGPTLLFGGNFRNSPSGDSYIAVWTGCDGPRRVDFNGDGVIDARDVAVLVQSWGPCAGCAADLNGDGLVDGEDFGILLGAW